MKEVVSQVNKKNTCYDCKRRFLRNTVYIFYTRIFVYRAPTYVSQRKKIYLLELRIFFQGVYVAQVHKIFMYKILD